MKIAIMQPYLFPYIGYFQLINSVDKYVVYDDVNFIKGGWVNRNNILVNNQKNLFTVILEQPSPFKLINEISIKDDFNKFLKTIHHSYSKAPFYQQTNSLLNEIFSFQEKNLGKFIINSIKVISKYMEIDTEFIISSELNKNNSLKNKEKVLHICDLLKANLYINAIGGQNLYDSKQFGDQGLELHFLKMGEVSYNQLQKVFVPNLSIIDQMMFNSRTQLSNLLQDFTLV